MELGFCVSLDIVNVRNLFAEGVKNVCSFLPYNADFLSLLQFKKSINQVDFYQFLKCVS